MFKQEGFIEVVAAVLMLAVSLTVGYLVNPALAQDRGTIARPVDPQKSFERSTFQADENQVWTLLTRILANRGFSFLIKDKKLGRIETLYIMLSRHPEFSKLSNGVKSLAKTPRLLEDLDRREDQDIC